jgi:hypothetical protein
MKMATKRYRRTEKEVADDAECSVVASASAACWKKLPEHLETEILGWLPVKYVYQYRSVCKHWNALLSSINFKNSIWAEAAINKQPWLVLWDGTTNMPCIAFCFYTRTWNTCFSLSFMEKQGTGKVNWRGSAAGLMLVDWSPFDAKETHGSLQPLYANFLPTSPDVKNNDRHQQCLVVNDNNAYKVVALGYCRQDGVASLCVEMYDGSQPGWKVAGFFQKKLKWSLVHGEMFFCDGSFYCMGIKHGI